MTLQTAGGRAGYSSRPAVLHMKELLSARRPQTDLRYGAVSAELT